MRKTNLTMTGGLLVMLILALTACKQKRNYFAELDPLIENHDTIGLKKLMAEWEQEGEKNGDYYVAQLGFHAFMARTTGEQLLEQMEGFLPDSLDDEGRAYAQQLFGGMNVYEDSVMQKGFAFVDEGIKKFPDRLDLRLGKADLLIQTYESEKAVDVIQGIIDRSAENKNEWYWEGDEKKEDGEDVMLEQLQDLFSSLYANDDIEQCERLTEIVLGRYPNHRIFRTDLAVVRALQEDYEGAKTLFEELHIEQPDDDIITANLAHVLLETNDSAKSLQLYQQLLSSENEDVSSFAEQMVGELTAGK